ncbi:MAG TPA: SDR family oxidoreductase [Solirubrobacteraceae bacterium]|nr:SDR family oxidoreductase [Solirubrobacteraceae bacterium]
MDLELTGRRAVITGGSRGIGLSCARVLAAEGVDLALVARDPEALDTAAGEVDTLGPGRVITVPTDTGDADSVLAMAKTVRAELGGADILINSAARPNTGRARPMGDDDLADEVNVKVAGYLRCARALAPGMVDSGWGRIINIAGLAARWTGSVTGSVRNVAVAAMTKNLADEYGSRGITVNVVHPGMTRTERTPDTLVGMAAAADEGTTVEQVQADLESRIAIGRMVTGEEIAWLVAFLASPKGVAVNGDAVVAGGGLRGTIHY